MLCVGCNRDLGPSYQKWVTRPDCKHTLCDFCGSLPHCAACHQNPLHYMAQQKEINNATGSWKIYIGNLPSSITEQELRLLFALCGPIKTTIIRKFNDHQNTTRAYGFVIFSEYESVLKALKFNKKVLKQHVIKVFDEKNADYSVFVQGIPPFVSKDLVKKYFEGYGTVTNVSPQNYGCFVSFKEEEVRQRVAATPLFLPPQHTPLRIQLKEPKPEMDFNPIPSGPQFSIFICNIPSRTTDEELLTMFRLCGANTSHVKKSQSMHTYGFVNFSLESARAFAMEFHESRPDGWDKVISMSDKKKDSTQQRNAFVDRRWSIKVTQFGDEVQEHHLRQLFADAGNILECVIKKNPNNGLRYAFVNFEKEESLEWALALNEERILGSQIRVEINRRKESNQAMSRNSSDWSISHGSHEQLSQGLSQMSLNGRNLSQPNITRPSQPQMNTFHPSPPNDHTVLLCNIPQDLDTSQIIFMFAEQGCSLGSAGVEIHEEKYGANTATVVFENEEALRKAKALELPKGADGSKMYIVH